MNTVQHTRPAATGTRRLFSNKLLESLTRTHIAVPVTFFIVYALVLLFWSVYHTSLSVTTTVSMFLVGLISFTWVEYNVHRYVFHIAGSALWKKRFQYVVHGVHHEFPKDKDRLAMPLLLSVMIATTLLLLSRFIMGDLAFSFMPGFLTGYAAYLAVHYMVHAFPRPKNFFKALWINHAIHHYKDGEIVFGVSSPLWDYIYGTMKTKST